METLVRTKADEINNSLIDFIKTSFKGKRIAVHIYEDEEDETEFLFNNEETKQRLLSSIENVNERKNLKEYTINEIVSYLNEAGDEKTGV